MSFWAHQVALSYLKRIFIRIKNLYVRCTCVSGCSWGPVGVELGHSLFSVFIRLFAMELAYFHKRLRLNLRSCTVTYRASNTLCIDMARCRRDILVTMARRHTCTATLIRHSHKARAAMRMPLKTHFTCSFKRVNGIYKTPAPSTLKIHSAHENRALCVQIALEKTERLTCAWESLATQP